MGYSMTTPVVWRNLDDLVGCSDHHRPHSPRGVEVERSWGHSNRNLWVSPHDEPRAFPRDVGVLVRWTCIVGARVVCGCRKRRLAASAEWRRIFDDRSLFPHLSDHPNRLSQCGYRFSAAGSFHDLCIHGILDTDICTGTT